MIWNLVQPKRIDPRMSAEKTDMVTPSIKIHGEVHAGKAENGRANVGKANEEAVDAVKANTEKVYAEKVHVENVSEMQTSVVKMIANLPILIVRTNEIKSK